MTWTTNLKLLPRFTLFDVEKWAEDGCRIPRAVLLKGYSNWIEGYITDIEGIGNTIEMRYVCPCYFVFS